MKFLSKINWRRVLTVLAGSGPALAALGDAIPPKWGMLGTGLIGLAISLERFMVKQTGPGPEAFDSAAAEKKLEGAKVE